MHSNSRCELQSLLYSTGSWSNLDTFALKLLRSKQALRKRGRAKVEHGRRTWWGGGEESGIAGDQSIIAPVGLYWLCSPTGLPRSMCFQAFCVGRWRSVPGLTLTFYRDMCVSVCILVVFIQAFSQMYACKARVFITHKTTGHQGFAMCWRLSSFTMSWPSYQTAVCPVAASQNLTASVLALAHRPRLTFILSYKRMIKKLSTPHDTNIRVTN